ncbi:MAG: ATP-dependent sacrificial sulfur transferase LarE [Nitrososphaeraceae archaeon]
MKKMYDSTFSKLNKWFENNKVLTIVAFSGGVDSSVVAFAARKALGNNAIAITANYNTLSDEDLLNARVVAEEIGIKHIIIKYNELKNSEFTKNDKLRCFYCRGELARHLINESRKLGAGLIVDGTNIDDLGDFRPGINAMRQHGIRSPLVEVGIRKDQVRFIAKSLNLSVYDRPSNSCLASRIPTGSQITRPKLGRVEKSESLVKSIFKVRQVRVRDHQNLARIEVGRHEIQNLFDMARLDLLDSELKALGFEHVTIDIAGYREREIKQKLRQSNISSHIA